MFGKLKNPHGGGWVSYKLKDILPESFMDDTAFGMIPLFHDIPNQFRKLYSKIDVKQHAKNLANGLHIYIKDILLNKDYIALDIYLRICECYHKRYPRIFVVNNTDLMNNEFAPSANGYNHPDKEVGYGANGDMSRNDLSDSQLRYFTQQEERKEKSIVAARKIKLKIVNDISINRLNEKHLETAMNPMVQSVCHDVHVGGEFENGEDSENSANDVQVCDGHSFGDDYSLDYDLLEQSLHDYGKNLKIKGCGLMIKTSL